MMMMMTIMMMMVKHVLETRYPSCCPNNSIKALGEERDKQIWGQLRATQDQERWNTLPIYGGSQCMLIIT